jgi:squalene-hopene/tetraprenyl-beta-curcumene cyclase
MASAGVGQSAIGNSQSAIRRWLLAQQYRVEHPYTHAAPGGWAWTNLPGGVPDADDTAGAVLALKNLGPIDDETRAAAFAGIDWLLNTQNSDGGLPTFCRGWGALPFDRSSADITAHTIRAWAAWWDLLPTSTGMSQRVKDAVSAALDFLFTNQRPNGAWAPLWFGNQHVPGETNLTYGTSRVVQALLAPDTNIHSLIVFGLPAVTRAARWLLEAQNPDGSWGGCAQGPASIEETALAVEALAAVAAHRSFPGRSGLEQLTPALVRGVNWLIDRVESGTWTEPAPIGFYFAKLWYFEQLYPLIFTVGALRKVAAAVHEES